MCAALIIGGHETAVNLIGNSVLALLRFPGERTRLLEQPELIESAVEEFLRYVEPSQLLARVATEDVEIVRTEPTRTS